MAEKTEDEQPVENWMDQEEIDYSLSMTKKSANLANQLQNFKKNK